MNFGRSIWAPVYLKMKGKETVESIVAQIEDEATGRLQLDLTKTGFTNLPDQIALVAIKEDQILEIWGRRDAKWVQIKTYPFTAFSGKLGPKLKEGDKQIPEGIYEIEYLNPNSLFYLSIKVSYPNKFDKAMATKDGRTNLGGDIFIHGKDKTIGCIPIGDEAIEEVFLLVSKTIQKRIKVVISPIDFRKKPVFPEILELDWEGELYEMIREDLDQNF